MGGKLQHALKIAGDMATFLGYRVPGVGNSSLGGLDFCTVWGFSYHCTSNLTSQVHVPGTFNRLEQEGHNIVPNSSSKFPTSGLWLDNLVQDYQLRPQKLLFAGKHHASY